MGVSLLVILLTLAAMAVAAGLAIPAFYSRHEVTLDSAARLLARDLSVARNMATYEGRACTFQFLPDGSGWRVLDDDGEVIERPDQKGRFERDLTIDGVFEGVRLGHFDFAGTNEVHFDRAGRALPGGTVRVSFEGEGRVLRVVALTGRVILDGLAEEYFDPER